MVLGLNLGKRPNDVFLAVCNCKKYTCIGTKLVCVRSMSCGSISYTIVQLRIYASVRFQGL